MGGSSSGKSRWDKTEVLKKQTKKRRRLEGKKEVDKATKEHSLVALSILILVVCSGLYWVELQRRQKL